MCDPYSDKKTGVLENKLGISNQEKLIAMERALSIEAIVELRKKKISTISFDTMKEIHKKIFGKIYSWAGVPRTVEISKGGTGFCRAMFIDGAAQDIFTKLKKKNFLKDLDRDAFCHEAANFFCDLNMLHPFREGNGRTQREVIFHLARNAGWELDLNVADKKRYLDASVTGTTDARKIQDIMLEIIKPLKKQKLLEGAAYNLEAIQSYVEKATEHIAQKAKGAYFLCLEKSSRMLFTDFSPKAMSASDFEDRCSEDILVLHSTYRASKKSLSESALQKKVEQNIAELGKTECREDKKEVLKNAEQIRHRR